MLIILGWSFDNFISNESVVKLESMQKDKNITKISTIKSNRKTINKLSEETRIPIRFHDLETTTGNKLVFNKVQPSDPILTDTRIFDQVHRRQRICFTCRSCACRETT